MVQYLVDGNAIGEEVVAQGDVGGFVGNLVLFVSQVPFIVFVNNLAVGVWHCLDVVACLSLLTAECKVGEQSSFFAVGTLRAKAPDERLWKGLTEEAYFVEVSVQPVFGVVYQGVFLALVKCGTEHGVAFDDAAKCIDGEGGA